MPSLEDLQGYLAIVTPAIAWFSTVALLAAVGFLVANAAKLRGHRSHTPAVDRAQARRDQLIFRAAFGSFVVVYFALIAGSFNNLTRWARNTVGWTGWEQYIVPLSLDGLGTAAGFLAFRAIKKRKSPQLCYAMVWGATVASAWINASEGSSHGSTAAFYMAFLSFGVMAMFHLFIEQWQEGAEYLGRKYPRFGIRWVTYPVPTLLDFLCWVNHPPEGLEPTVVNAVAHREEYRNRKRDRKHQRQLEAERRLVELAEARAERAPEPAPEQEPEAVTEARPEPQPEADRKPRPERKATGDRKRNIAKEVADYRKKNPEATQVEVARKLRITDRTVRNHWHNEPSNVTPILKEAAK